MPCAVCAPGVLRILIDKKLDRPGQAVVFARRGYQGPASRPGRGQVLSSCSTACVRVMNEGVDVSVYLSVRALQPGSALDFDQRVQAD